MLFRNAANNTDDSSATALLELGWNTEDHEDNWLISYADLLSVIFAMVVLLFGRMLAAAAAAPVAVADVESIDTAERAAIVAPEPSASPSTQTAPESAREDRLAALVDERFAGRIETRRRDRGIALAIPAVALFTSARANLEPGAIPLLTELTATLREVGDARIAVEGHTDDQPVLGGAFDSNWDLAAARANAVTRFLLEQGFAPTRLQSVSYADTRPVADNATADGRAANRRVELQIELADETG